MDKYFSNTIHHAATVKQVVKGELKYVADMKSFVDPRVGAQVLGDILMVIMIVLIIGGNFMVHYFEGMILTDLDDVLWFLPKMTSLLISIQILSTDYVWWYLSKWLVDREHHTSAADWNSSWLRKMFPVRLINNIYPFFFVGLIKQYTKVGCPDLAEGCISELEVQLYVFFAVRFLKQIAQDVILFLITKLQVMNEMAKVSHEKHYTFLEVQAKSLEFDDSIRLNDWSEQIMAFVFVSCFNVVLPAVAPIALFTSMLRQRCFVYRNVCFLRRPVPVASIGIGPWQTLFEIAEVLAVILNLSFAAFAMKPIKDFAPVYKWAIFVGAQYAIFMLKLCVRGKFPIPPRRVDALAAAADETIRKVFLDRKSVV